VHRAIELQSTLVYMDMEIIMESPLGDWIGRVSSLKAKSGLLRAWVHNGGLGSPLDLLLSADDDYRFV
jgi:hypothetical protein